MDTLRPGAKPSGEEGLLRSLSVFRKEFMELKSSVKRELHEVQQVRASLIFFDYICLVVQRRGSEQRVEGSHQPLSRRDAAAQ